MAGRKRRVTGDEVALFARAMEDARPLKHVPAHIRPQVKTHQASAGEKIFRAALSVRSHEHKPVASVKPKAAPPIRVEGRSALTGMDRRNAERFSRGKMEIEGHLDLHGRTQEQAHRTLRHFITASHAAQKRCVLIITGKGSARETVHTGDRFTMPERKGGVLHRLVPQWLAEPELGLHVVAFHPAQPKDGGDGALYVYLRRQRQT